MYSDAQFTIKNDLSALNIVAKYTLKTDYKNVLGTRVKIGN